MGIATTIMIHPKAKNKNKFSRAWSGFFEEISSIKSLNKLSRKTNGVMMVLKAVNKMVTAMDTGKYYILAEKLLSPRWDSPSMLCKKGVVNIAIKAWGYGILEARSAPLYSSQSISLKS